MARCRDRGRHLGPELDGSGAEFSGPRGGPLLMLNLLRNSGAPRHWLCPHRLAERARTGSSVPWAEPLAAPGSGC